MADVLTPLYPEETEGTIAQRWKDWANEDVDPGDDDYVDTEVGSLWWLLTRTGIREFARVYDLMGTEVIAASFPQFAWGTYLDDHAERQGIDRNEATAAGGDVVFSGPAATTLNPGITVLVPAADTESDPIEFTTTDGGTINAPLSPPTPFTATPQNGGGLTNGTTYRWVVTAVDDAGETLVSAEAVVTIANPNKQVLLAWTAVAGARSYRVYRRTGATGPPYDFLVETTATSFPDSAIVAIDNTRHPPTLNTTGGKLLVPVTAVETGAAGNVGADAVTEITPPIQDVTVTNPQPMLGGADTEGDEPLRGRVEGDFTAAGGANVAFYVKKALDFPGVGRVTVIPMWDGDNTVLVVISAADGQPVSQAIIDGLQAELDPDPGAGAGDAPVGAEVTVATNEEFDVTVTATLELDTGYSLDGDGGTVALRDLIQAAVNAYIVSVPAGGEIVLRAVIKAIMEVTGVHDVSVALSPGAGGNGNIAVPDSPPAVATLATLTLTEGTV